MWARIPIQKWKAYEQHIVDGTVSSSKFANSVRFPGDASAGVEFTVKGATVISNDGRWAAPEITGIKGEKGLPGESVVERSVNPLRRAQPHELGLLRTGNMCYVPEYKLLAMHAGGGGLRLMPARPSLEITGVYSPNDGLARIGSTIYAVLTTNFGGLSVSECRMAGRLASYSSFFSTTSFVARATVLEADPSSWSVDATVGDPSGNWRRTTLPLSGLYVDSRTPAVLSALLTNECRAGSLTAAPGETVRLTFWTNVLVKSGPLRVSFLGATAGAHSAGSNPSYTATAVVPSTAFSGAIEYSISGLRSPGGNPGADTSRGSFPTLFVANVPASNPIKVAPRLEFTPPNRVTASFPAAFWMASPSTALAGVTASLAGFVSSSSFTSVTYLISSGSVATFTSNAAFDAGGVGNAAASTPVKYRAVSRLRLVHTAYDSCLVEDSFGDRPDLWVLRSGGAPPTPEEVVRSGVLLAGRGVIGVSGASFTLYAAYGPGDPSVSAVTGSPVPRPTGRPAYSVAYTDPQDHWMDGNHRLLLSPGFRALTVALWTSIESPASGDLNILGFFQGASILRYCSRGYYMHGTAKYTPIKDGEWTHHCVLMSGGSMSHYVNGSPAGSAVPGGPGGPGGSYSVGQHPMPLITSYEGLYGHVTSVTASDIRLDPACLYRHQLFPPRRCVAAGARGAKPTRSGDVCLMFAFMAPLFATNVSLVSVGNVLIEWRAYRVSARVDPSPYPVLSTENLELAAEHTVYVRLSADTISLKADLNPTYTTALSGAAPGDSYVFPDSVITWYQMWDASRFAPEDYAHFVETPGVRPREATGLWNEDLLQYLTAPTKIYSRRGPLDGFDLVFAYAMDRVRTDYGGLPLFEPLRGGQPLGAVRADECTGLFDGAAALAMAWAPEEGLRLYDQSGQMPPLEVLGGASTLSLTSYCRVCWDGVVVRVNGRATDGSRLRWDDEVLTVHADSGALVFWALAPSVTLDLSNVGASSVIAATKISASDNRPDLKTWRTQT